MNITPTHINRVLGAANLVVGVGLGAFAIREAATQDVPAKRTVQLVAGGVAMAGIGAAILAPNSPRLLLPALGVSLLGAATYMGIGVTNT